MFMCNAVDSATLTELELFSVQIAKECGRILRQYSPGIIDVQFKDQHGADPVTEVDLRIQEYLKGIISKEFPSHDILSEEDLGSQIGSDSLKDFIWCLDPLDGTANFMGGLSLYGVSIALLHRGYPVVGSIYIPEGAMNGGVYHARVGGGALYEDTPLIVGDKKVLIPSSLTGLPANAERVFYIKRDKSYILGETRVTGSMSCEMALVSAGTFQYSLMWKPRIWDVAAGAVLINEAGGAILEWINGDWKVFTDFNRGLVIGISTSGITKEDLSSWTSPLLMGNPDLIENLAPRMRVKNKTWRITNAKIKQVIFGR